MWLFYRYFYKSSGVICELGSTFPVLLEQGVYGALGAPELFSSEPGGERDKHSLFQTLPTFLELQLLVQFLCSPKRGTIHSLSWQSFCVTCPKGTQVLEGNFLHKSALVWVFCWFSLRI